MEFSEEALALWEEKHDRNVKMFYIFRNIVRNETRLMQVFSALSNADLAVIDRQLAAQRAKRVKK